MRAALAGAVLAALALAPPAVALEVEPLLARIDKSAAAVDTLAGEFTQRSRLKLFRQELASRGRLYYHRPRQLRWEYLEPDASVLVVDGDKATLAAPGAPPRRFDLARDPTMRAVTEQLLLWLGAGPLGRVKADYQLAAAGTDDAPSLLLTPRPATPMAKAFQRIELRFDRQLLLRTILLREVSGDEKEIAFTRLERNARLPPDAFALARDSE